MYFVHRELFVLLAVPRKEIYSGSTFRNITYLASAEQEHHSVELSEKIILLKSVLPIHSPATKKELKVNEIITFPLVSYFFFQKYKL